MTNHTDTLYTTATGGFFAGVAFLLGGLDNLIIALVLFMTIDYATGISASLTTKETSSKNAFKGLIKKGAMITLVIVAHQLDVITGVEGHFMRNAMIFFLIGTEGISILENMNKLGVKFPAFLAQRFEQMVNHNDKKKDDER